MKLRNDEHTCEGNHALPISDVVNGTCWTSHGYFQHDCDLYHMFQTLMSVLLQTVDVGTLA